MKANFFGSILGRWSRFINATSLSLLLAAAAQRASAATFVVSSAMDNAVAPNLRRAISDANANPGLDVIVFDFTAYPATLTFSSPLPDIIESVVIDGTDPNGCLADMPPRIQLDGLGLGPNANGLAARGTAAQPIGVTIKGLAVYRFPGAGILLEYNTNSVIAGNHIGTDAAGNVPLPNGAGLVLNDCRDAIVGGTGPCQRNVISGNQRGGLEIHSGADHRVIGNYIGISANAQWAVPNGVGVVLNFGKRCQIGSLAPGEGNVISRNLQEGLLVIGGLGMPMESRIEGNFIGTLAGGSFPAPNGGDGIFFLGGPTRNHVRGNVIAHNGGSGVMVFEGIDNEIVENSIFNNTLMGIDLSPRFAPNPNDACDPDEGPNRQQNFPTLAFALSLAASVQIDGVLDSESSRTYRLDFYWNPACDGFGFGEGRHYIGQATVTNGIAGQCVTPFNVNFPVHVPPGVVITATATHPEGSTSEFSPCVNVLDGGGGVINHAGLPHAPVGGATLTPRADGTLEVGRSATGGSGRFGAQIALGRAQGWIGQFDQLRLELGQTLELETDMPLPGDEPEKVKAVTEIVIAVDTSPKLSALFDPSTRVARLSVDEVDDNGTSVNSTQIPNGGTYQLPLCSSNGGVNVLACGVVRLKSGVSAVMWQFVDDGYGPGCGTTNPPVPQKPPKVRTFLAYPDMALPGAGGFTAAGPHPCEPWPDCLIPGYILDIKVIQDPGCLSCPNQVFRLKHEWVQQFDSLHQLAGNLNNIVSWHGPHPWPWRGTLTAGSERLGDLLLDIIPGSPSLPLPPPQDAPDPHLAPDFANAARYICLDLDITLPSLPGVGGPAGGGIFDRSLQFVVAGPVRPRPGEPVQDRLVFRGGVRGWAISADFSGSGAAAAMVEAYLHGVRVLGPMPLESLQLDSLPNRVAASTSVSPTGAAGFTLFWAEAVSGPQPLPWDELRISALSPANPLLWLSRVSIQGIGIERLEILGENTKPARPGPLTIVRIPGLGMSLSYPTEPGRPYRLEYKNSLNAPAWELLDSFLGDGSVRQVNDPVRPGQSRFYRLGGP